MKDFDTWNRLKKEIHQKKEEFFVKQREIRYIHMGINIGFETDGKGEDFKRPVLVLKKIG